MGLFVAMRMGDEPFFRLGRLIRGVSPGRPEKTHQASCGWRTRSLWSRGPFGFQIIGRPPALGLSYRRPRLAIPPNAMNLSPEHLHLAINHLPFLGSGLALVPLLVGILRRHRPTLLTALALAAVCGWTTPLVMETGESAYHRYESGPARPYLDPQAASVMEIHEEHAETAAALFYLSALTSSLALGLNFKPLPGARLSAWAAAAAAFLALGAGVWVADSGGQIRRPDFRSPPQQPAH